MINKDSIINIADELLNGLDVINGDESNVTMIGSARLKPDNYHYQLAYDTAKLLGNSGYNIITGGGPGIMEAASHGGYDAGVKTYGINIILPHEQSHNKYVTVPYICNHFHTRKYIMYAKTKAIIAFAGGFGTMDELYEALTLYTTNNMNKMPIILVGSEFWNVVYANVANMLEKNGLIDKTEQHIMQILDTKEEVLQLINDYYK